MQFENFEKSLKKYFKDVQMYKKCLDGKAVTEYQNQLLMFHRNLLSKWGLALNQREVLIQDRQQHGISRRPKDTTNVCQNKRFHSTLYQLIMSHGE